MTKFVRMRRRVPVVLQATVTDCGPACLAMVLAHHGRAVALEQLRDELGVGPRRRHRARPARRREPPRAELPRLAQEPGHGPQRCPCRSSSTGRRNHFVVVERVRRDSVDLVDPVLGRRRISFETFATAFAGAALTFAVERTRTRGDLGHRPAAAPWRTVLSPVLRLRRSVLAALAATSALLLARGARRAAGHGVGGRPPRRRRALRERRLVARVWRCLGARRSRSAP